MATTNTPLEFDGLHTGAAGNYIPYAQLGDTGEVITTPDSGWTVAPNIALGRVYDLPDCKEAITILEEAEYELKELLKKNPTVKNIEIALRSTQSALRALLKVS